MIWYLLLLIELRMRMTYFHRALLLTFLCTEVQTRIGLLAVMMSQQAQVSSL